MDGWEQAATLRRILEVNPFGGEYAVENTAALCMLTAIAMRPDGMPEEADAMEAVSPATLERLAAADGNALPSRLARAFLAYLPTGTSEQFRLDIHGHAAMQLSKALASSGPASS